MALRGDIVLVRGRSIERAGHLSIVQHSMVQYRRTLKWTLKWPSD